MTSSQTMRTIVLPQAFRKIVPPMMNTPQLARRLRVAWSEAMGDARVVDIPTQSMVAEDFPFFTVDPDIASVYWQVGGTPQEDFDRQAAGVTAVGAVGQEQRVQHRHGRDQDEGGGQPARDGGHRER